MSDVPFTKFVPGFEFLQGLVKTAGESLPGIGQWVAPTLNPEELGKRIEELRTVQFWLEQNARMLGATIQALEVQRMTLSTLKTLNVPVAQLKDALKVPERPAQATPAPKKKTGQSAGAAASVDPMQWWGALTQQFSQVAAQAMKEGASEAAKGLASGLVKQSIDAAGDTLRKAATVPQAMADSLTKTLTTPGAKAKPGPAAPKAPARKTATKRP